MLLVNNLLKLKKKMKSESKCIKVLNEIEFLTKSISVAYHGVVYVLNRVIKPLKLARFESASPHDLFSYSFLVT